MGMLVAFWSPWHGRGNTANCIAAATQFSYRFKANVIITHTQYTRASMESNFLTGKENEDMLNFSDMGIDAMERALQTGRLSNKDFISYCNKINNNLYLLSGSKKTNKNLFASSIGQTIENICKFSKNANDITFIDVASGMNDEVTKKVLDLSDLIVVTLEQSNIVCKHFFHKEIKNLNKDKIVTMIGRYDFESSYSKEYIDKKFKQDVFVLPQLTEYLDALNNNNVNKFFNAYHILEDEPFFVELNRLNDYIVEKANELEIKFEPTDPSPAKKSIFSFLKG